MISAFGVNHGDEVSKKIPGIGSKSAGGLKGLLTPYKGAVPKNQRQVISPVQRRVRSAARNKQYYKDHPTGKPGFARGQSRVEG